MGSCETKETMKVLLFTCLLSIASAADCPEATEENTLIAGSMPVPVNPEWMRPLECEALRGSFTNICGAWTARPACFCTNGDAWFHPYWKGSCAEDGKNPYV